jgi:hypothetical protein
METRQTPKTCHKLKDFQPLRGTQRGPLVAYRLSLVYVYDEKNCQIFSMAAGNGPDDGLHSFSGEHKTRPCNVQLQREGP